MRIDIQVQDIRPLEPARVGNVYPIKGGRGLKYGHLQILMAITKPKESWQGPMGLMLVVDKLGEPQGVNSYGMHYIEELCPVAFVDGLDEIELTMRGLA